MNTIHTVNSLVVDESNRISQALGIPTAEARRDAQVLLCWSLQVSRGWLAAHDRDGAEPGVAARLHALCGRRVQGEPTAYITGTREFHGIDFAVSPAVLIPRPDTELVVERALSLLPDDAPHTILDLGTGSGAIAVTLALLRPQARIVASDVCSKALAVARENARRHALTTIRFIASDWYTALAMERFDLIVCNPPYVANNDAHLRQLRYEPSLALLGGTDGLASLRAVISGAPAHLNRGGHLLLEHGFDQSDACADLLRQAGFVRLESHVDLAGIARVAHGQLEF